MVEKLFPEPSLKIQIIVSQIEGYQSVLKLSCRPFAFTSYKVFSKIKSGFELVSLPHFLNDF